MKSACIAMIAAAAASSAHAAVLQFDFAGKGGAGLISANENVATINGTPGTGGEIGAGITFDDVTRILTINVGWGSANGFTNLSGNAVAGHLHGPTAAGGTASFTQNASVRYGLDNLAGWNNSAVSGGFIGSITINAADVAALLNGQFYMNVHTAANGSGEIRGNLVLVPAPGAAAAFGVLGLVGTRRRR
ncbi:MAG: CHRD domain-containing protein [Planctomycetota bacterium]|nr:CHRD domain-containing protein [Planctomycetota bacterium]